MKRTITIQHDGKTYNGEPMTITAANLGYEGPHVPALSLTCEGNGSGVNIGGITVGPKSGLGIGMVFAILETLGVDQWRDVVGQDVVVLFGPDDRGVGFAHRSEDRLFIFDEYIEIWRHDFA